MGACPEDVALIVTDTRDGMRSAAGIDHRARFTVTRTKQATEALENAWQPQSCQKIQSSAWRDP